MDGSSRPPVIPPKVPLSPPPARFGSPSISSPLGPASPTSPGGGGGGQYRPPRPPRRSRTPSNSSPGPGPGSGPNGGSSWGSSGDWGSSPAFTAPLRTASPRDGIIEEGSTGPFAAWEAQVLAQTASTASISQDHASRKSMSPSGSKITWADQSHHQTQPTPPVPQSLPLASVPIAPTPRHAGPSAEKNWITCSDSEGWIGYGHKGSGSMARGSSPAHERSGSNTSTAGSASASASASALVSAPVLPPRPTVTTHTSERSASSTKPSFLLEYGLEEEGEEDSDHDQGHDKEQVRKPPAVIMNRLRSRSRSRSGSGASSAKGSTGSGGNRIVVVVSNQSTTSETAQPAVPAVSVVTDQDANGQEIEDETQYSYTGRRAPRPRQLHEIAQAQAQAARLTPPALPARPRSAPSVTQEVIASSVPASTAATGTASAATAQSATSQGADEHGQLTADPFEMDGNADTAGAGDAFAIATEQTATGIPQTRTSRALGEIGLAVATHAVPGLWGARPSSESNAPASSSLAIAIANGSNVCAREAPTQDGNSVPEDALMDAGTAPAPVPPALPPRRPNGVSLTDGISQVDGVPQPDGDVPQPAPAPASTKTLAKEEKAREKARKKEEELRRKEEDARLKRQKKLETQKQQQEEMERKVLMASWEELEVARYLSDFGKHVREVRSVARVYTDDMHDAPVRWPTRADWTSGTGAEQRVNWFGYALSYLTSVAYYLSPSSVAPLGSSLEEHLIPASGEDTDFKLTVLRVNAERLYIVALPFYESLARRLRKIWRWENVPLTGSCATAYTLLWIRGLLLPAFFVCIIVLVLRLRFHPPQPSALRAAIQRQQRREAEVTQAHEIAEKGEGAQVLEEAQRPRASSSTSSGSEAGASTTGDGGSKSQPVEAGIASTMATIRKESAKASKRSQYGLAADAARRYGHEATVLTGSLADAHERAKNMALWRAPVATVRALVWLGLMAFGSLYLTPWILVRSIGLLLGALFFVLLPIVEYHPELLPKDNPVDLLLAGVPNDAQCAIQILRKRAAAGQPLVSDPALLLSASSAEGEGGGQGGINKLSRRSMESSSSSASLSSLAPSAMQAEREAGAKDAKEGNKVDWGKWRARAARGRDMAIKGSEMLAGHRGIYLPRVVAEGEEPTLRNRLERGAELVGRTFDAARDRSGSRSQLFDTRLDGSDESAVLEGSYFAVYEGSPGHLIVLPTRVLFKATFAKRVRSSTIATTSSSSSSSPAVQLDGTAPGEEPLLNATTGEEAPGAQDVKVRTLIDVGLEQIMGLKKTKSVNLVVWSTSGLQLKLKEDKVLTLSNMVKRDECFNRLLALAPQQWRKV